MKLSINRPAPPRIEMLPLIDVVFLLLVFFIFAMLSMAVHRGQPVDLPSSNTAPAEQQEAVSITIQTAGKGIILFIDERMVKQDQLSRELQQKKAEEYGDKSFNIQVFADRSVSYQDLFKVLDGIHQAGLTQISLQARQGKDGS